ncbi:MAG: NADPH-dependent glutamate synthase [Bacillota bacterium]|nr:NADPH-dependent glutamate synthase [Bacillota bacterium]
MPKQPPGERRKNFREVALGLTPELAVAEARRCLQCKNPPCVTGCPVQVPIKEFIGLIGQGDPAAALKRIREKNLLPAICGRVCPQEVQCEAKCVWAKKGEPIAIGALERFAADHGAADAAQPGRAVASEASPAPAASTARPSRARVAVVGSGPAGLTAAAELARHGYRVTVFESLHAAGGVLRYGIPEFRLPKSVLDAELDGLRRLGVEIECDVVVGQTVTLEDLWAEGFRAVFVGTGAGLPHFLGVAGENLNGVYSANEFLTRANLMRAYEFPETDTPIRTGRRVAVVGGGNVAMDSARTALRLGAEQVMIVYRRSREELPARREEVENAEEEGIEFRFLQAPTRILGDERGQVVGLEVQRMELGEPDASGRRRPVPVPGAEEVIPVDTVISAIGQGPNPLFIRYTPGLATTAGGQIAVDENGETSLRGVFAGGDIVTGAATVILAMGAGKEAAHQIHRRLEGQL